jgi:hypothetical protein
VRTKRREILKAGLGAGALFLPAPYAWVWAQQSDGSLKLSKAPKMALVIGNGKYKNAAELRNAPGDAKAIGGALKASGFEVTLKLDTGREEMLEAIRAYVHLMEQKKHVGLFYFAGHGVQLAWRNYLLPVDAAIGTIDDVARQSVEIARLIDGLSKAANPMNVIILDACRENPLGKSIPVEHKGLSQMDAPNSSLLAYATSPGNVASDGDGANGLYTENLLREIKVPEAKIEDVFKRVRLGVRRKSNGAQIPWESTSLEEDFWFLPPREAKKLSEEDRNNAFKEELALWEKVQNATAPAPLEDYLRRFPSGKFSELAQLRLEQVLAKQGEKKIALDTQSGNPFTKGSASVSLDIKVGDSYSNLLINLMTNGRRNETETVTKVTEAGIELSSGRIIDPLGNVIRTRDGRTVRGAQTMPLDYAVGKHWTTRFITAFADGRSGDTEFSFKVVTRENIAVPAGSFNAFRIEGSGVYAGPMPTGQIGRVLLAHRHWVAPEQLRIPTVVMEETLRLPNGVTLRSSRAELESFKQS